MQIDTQLRDRSAALPASGTLLAALLFALPAPACGPGHGPAEERVRLAREATGEIVVAAVWPWQQRADIRYGEGLDMAVSEVNASGGIQGKKLRVQRYDDRESLDQGMIVAHRIAADPHVTAVIGHLQSYVTAPAAAIYELGGLLLIAPTATDPALTSHGHRRVFQATFTDRDAGRQLAELARARFTRVAICYIRNPYGRGLANAFEERGSEIGLDIVARHSYDAGEQIGTRTFEATVREWSSLELDAVFLAGEVPSAGLFVAEARKQGLDVPILGGDAIGSPSLFATAGQAAEGMVVAGFFHPDEPRPEVQRWKAAFEQRFGGAPDAGSALGYDVIQLLARAMRHAKSSEPDRVAQALHQLPPWDGITGSFRFDAQGAAVGRRLVKMVVRDGRFAYLPDAPSSI
jgi:branched-chain amino acid transport system substrate-binding protein